MSNSVYDSDELDVPVTFGHRPVGVPGDLRPAWRVGLILLAMKRCCVGGRTSFARLHLLSWTSLDSRSGTDLLTTLSEGVRSGVPLVRVEPALNRAVDRAVGAGLLIREGGTRVALTPAGVEAARLVDSNPDVYKREREYLKQLGRRVTESFVKQLFSRRG